MYYRLAADALSALHLGLMLFVVFGQMAILVGIVCRWRWIRNPYFRWIHMAIILTVAAEAVLNINCPLTDWETDLRRKGRAYTDDAWYVDKATRAVAAQALARPVPPVGQIAGGCALGVAEAVAQTIRAADAKSFTERLLHYLLFPDVSMDFLFACYLGFAAAVVLSFLLAPPWIRGARGQVVLKLGCAGGATAPPSVEQARQGKPGYAVAHVAVERPRQGACTTTVICPRCEQKVGIEVKSRRSFALRAVGLALLGLALAAAGFFWAYLERPTPEAYVTHKVWQNTVTVIGLVLFVLAPSGLLIRKALVATDTASPTPNGRHRLFA